MSWFVSWFLETCVRVYQRNEVLEQVHKIYKNSLKRSWKQALRVFQMISKHFPSLRVREANKSKHCIHSISRSIFEPKPRAREQKVLEGSPNDRSETLPDQRHEHFQRMPDAQNKTTALSKQISHSTSIVKQLQSKKKKLENNNTSYKKFQRITCKNKKPTWDRNNINQHDKNTRSNKRRFQHQHTDPKTRHNKMFNTNKKADKVRKREFVPEELSEKC